MSGAVGTTAGASSRIQTEVLEALIGLGYSTTEAHAALAKIPQDQALTLEQQITYALRTFSRQ
jgi:Holliday junction DNA helicase RuvA